MLDATDTAVADTADRAAPGVAGRSAPAGLDDPSRGGAVHDALAPEAPSAEPADAVVPLPAGLARRTIYMLSPVVHGLFGVLAFAGALSTTTDALGPVAGMVARMLYLSSALLSFFLTTMIVAVRLSVRRGGVRPPLSVPLVYAMSPITGGLLLAAAYVSQLNGGPFAGGWGAMLLTTLSLVMLTRRSRTRP